MIPKTPSTSSSNIVQDKQDEKVIACNECKSTYVVPHLRQIHRKRRGTEKSQGANNISVTDLVFRSDKTETWETDITFRKRNIIWKAIKTKKTEDKQLFEPDPSNDAKILQNEDPTDQEIAPEQISDTLAEGRCPSCNSLLDMDDDYDLKNMEANDSDSSSSNSSLDDEEVTWDDNAEIISHTLSELDVHENGESNKSFQYRRRSKRTKWMNNISDMPKEIQANTNLHKYWANRYEIFHKYDQGIQLDKESWYSVTPERIAKQIAIRCKCNVIIDAFCGAGGNAIQFAFTCNKVIAIDIDPKKIELARNNAKIYGVEKKIEFITGDFLELAPKLEGDVVFLSPPWGGPKYSGLSLYDLKLISPVGGKDIYKAAKQISKSVAYFLPKNINIKQVRMLAKRGQSIETELYLEQDKLIALTCYYGELLTKMEE